MGAARKTTKFSNEVLDELIRSGGSSEGLLGSGGLLQQLKGALMERILTAEMDEHLGYEKHAKRENETGNNRNGSTGKTVQTESGPVRIEVPRDRTGHV